jgi:hypothetical protein
MKETVPVGVPLKPAVTLETVAVKVTAWFSAEGLGLEPRAALVLALLTVCARTLLLLPLKLLPPA